ncbi:hypothetical protein RI129_012746 [Pyrocoelia pectoralis]|uniref:Scavenger receptor class B member 1 n=1 Tax=Pyrocoelia pectoralis TaxID=417401 RepID=A0AAN7ZF77_9COLE
MSKIYPNLDLDYKDDRRYSNQSETKCAQIFTKGTTLTKDIFEKIDDDFGPMRSASICGRNFNTRNVWVLCGLSVLFLTSCCGMGLMFGTNTFDEYMLSQMVLINNSLSYQLWKGPVIKTFVRVYVFNYTNVDDYENGDDEKLHVNEIGPYVYEESLERVNIKFLANGTVSYQEKREHRYREDLSNGRLQNDTVVVPNLPLLSAAALSKEYLYPFRLMISGVFEQLDAKPFINVPVDKLIWGYDDVFYSVVKSVMSFYKTLPFEKFGILASKKGVSEDILTAHTGINDINKVKQIDTVNGKKYTPYWGTDQCNEVKGSDGTAFSPMDVRERRPVLVYNKEMGRTVKLTYEKDVKIFNGKVTAARYVVPSNTFDTPEKNFDNECYCDESVDECPQGVFNTAACTFGAPIFMSFPHFHNAEDTIKESVSGLNKAHQMQENYVYIHPTLGFSMGGKNSMQLNVQVQKSIGIKQLEMFDDDIILPMAWIQVGIDDVDLPEVVTSTIYFVSVTVPAIELCLKYGSILGAIVTLISILIILHGRKMSLTHRFRDMER